MAQAEIYTGTPEEILRLLAEERFVGRKMRLVVGALEEADEEDFTDSLPTPPNTVRDRAHLDELLMAGINSPGHVITDYGLVLVRIPISFQANFAKISVFGPKIVSRSHSN